MKNLSDDPAMFFLIVIIIIAVTCILAHAINVFGHSSGAIYIGPAKIDGGVK